MSNTNNAEAEDRKDNAATEQEETTEQKAAAIGKKLDDATAEEEAVPDYEVSEEGTETEVEAPTTDERLGKTRETEEAQREQPVAAASRLSNREKRQLRKKKLADKFDAKDKLIRQQQEMINQLAGRVNDVDSRLSQFDQAQLQQAWNETSAVFQQAEQEHASAFKEQDGTKATAAMRKMYDAQRRLDELQGINAKMQQRQATPAPQKPSAPDPIMVSKATDWARRNSWFRNDGGDDDSAIANAIAAKLVKDGYDATSDDYWDELDQRLGDRGIGSNADEDDDDEVEVRRPAKVAPRKEAAVQAPVRRTPPVSGSNGRGDLAPGKQAVTLPTAYINALKESGKWEEREVRNRMIRRYLDGLKERQTGR
jgi:hypothetical protein